jgi:hypothetical protein
VIHREPGAKLGAPAAMSSLEARKNGGNWSDFDQFGDHFALPIPVFDPPNPRHAGFLQTGDSLGV